MECTNPIIEVRFKNGKQQIIHPQVVSEQWLDKYLQGLNGTWEKTICNGLVECHITASNTAQYEWEECQPEVQVSFECSKCGKVYPMDIDIKYIENMINDNL